MTGATQFPDGEKTKSDSSIHCCPIRSSHPTQPASPSTASRAWGGRGSQLHNSNKGSNFISLYITVAVLIMICMPTSRRWWALACTSNYFAVKRLLRLRTTDIHTTGKDTAATAGWLAVKQPHSSTKSSFRQEGVCTVIQWGEAHSFSFITVICLLQNKAG